MQTNDSFYHNPSQDDALAFAEWVCANYTRLHGCWVGIYQNQIERENWKQTEQLWAFWWKSVKDQPAP